MTNTNKISVKLTGVSKNKNLAFHWFKKIEA
jgi:hypothetical protein